jgi:hypothetical protein
MQTLIDWYLRVSAQKGAFQFVLLIQDFEGFEVNVMVDLISILWYIFPFNI